MGIYVYVASKSKLASVKIEGRHVAVHAMRFHSKPLYGSFDRRDWRYEALAEARENQIDRAWGEQRPEYVAFPTGDNDKFKNGDAVYRWNGGIWWDDGGDLPGIRVGTLQKVGRRWQLVPDTDSKEANA